MVGTVSRISEFRKRFSTRRRIASGGYVEARAERQLRNGTTAYGRAIRLCQAGQTAMGGLTAYRGKPVPVDREGTGGAFKPNGRRGRNRARGGIRAGQSRRDNSTALSSALVFFIRSHFAV